MKTTTDIFATLSASPSAFLRRKEVWRHWKWPAFVYLLFLASCTLEYEMRTCPYNVLIHYVTSDGRGFATGDYPVEFSDVDYAAEHEEAASKREFIFEYD